ncbi:hypothetical protein [Rhodococcus sp. O3]|uniref:hypothetical protein n=1 Tax=Rhodococcus sp. O3 TaxID=3404919 RepID=UPI003B67FB92
MASRDISENSGALEPETEYVFFVYDKGDGTILHTHQVVNLPGAEAPSREQMEQTALSYVSPQAREQAEAGLAVLSVDPQQLKRGQSYRVDHERKTLVAVERER